jgi:hypothetical protein
VKHSGVEVSVALTPAVELVELLLMLLTKAVAKAAAFCPEAMPVTVDS